MKTKEIQKKIKKLESQKEEIENQITSYKSELNNESEKTKWIPIPETDYELTKDVLYKGKSYDEIMELKKPEEELLTLKLMGIICEHPDLIKELKMDSSSTEDDFLFKQPFPQNEKDGRVAWFYAGSDYADLDCYGDSDDSNSALGVRFKWKVKTKKSRSNN